MNNKGEIILYQPDNFLKLEVLLEKNYRAFQLLQNLQQLLQMEKYTMWIIIILMYFNK
jgi:hypothetical protein